ncbi:MAG: lipopolysaccharide kinase InaA family protein [Planctomycetota bacterium]
MFRSLRQDSKLEISEKYRSGLEDAGLGTFEALLTTPGNSRLDKPGLADWRTRLVIDLPDGTTCFLKRYDRPPLSEQLEQRLAGHPSTASAEWGWMQRFFQLGLPGPEPVAYGLRRGGLMLEKASVVVTAKVPGESLEKWAPREAEPGGRLGSRRFKNALIHESARVVARMHEAGLYHRDLYLAHLYFDDQTAEGDDTPRLRLTMIDLQRVIQPRLLAFRWMVKDLASLHYSTPIQVASRSDRIRWLRSYLSRRRLRLMLIPRSLRPRLLAYLVEYKKNRISRHDRRRRARFSR